ncbi:hypothetical protein L873DRAFT_424949 [Choiromyces venosus 120613-1]|uniref:Uncharacterized protein n=1 Tax=Choiromyces venosus 120613-1 TaxID=1336337 RepID=A0A3N4JWB6_9PEZI|nr:hypothetical protein L873DRAFT_424949 [Choiromyces venosus 120613-1]
MPSHPPRSPPPPPKKKPFCSMQVIPSSGFAIANSDVFPRSDSEQANTGTIVIIRKISTRKLPWASYPPRKHTQARIKHPKCVVVVATLQVRALNSRLCMPTQKQCDTNLFTFGLLAHLISFSPAGLLLFLRFTAYYLKHARISLVLLRRSIVILRVSLAPRLPHTGLQYHRITTRLSIFLVKNYNKVSPRNNIKSTRNTIVYLIHERSQIVRWGLCLVEINRRKKQPHPRSAQETLRPRSAQFGAGTTTLSGLLFFSIN